MLEKKNVAPSFLPRLPILITMSVLGPLALNIFIPSMPGLQKALHTDYATAQLTLTFFLLSSAISHLFIGALSDRFGRRNILLFGISTFVLASYMCSQATSIEHLILGRILQAAGASTGVTLSRAMIRDTCERDNAARLLGAITMAMAIAPMVSPALGGYLDVWAGWRANFYLVALIGTLFLIVCLATLPETNKDLAPSFGFAKLPRQYFNTLKNRAFLSYVFCMAFNSAVVFAFIGGAPFIAIEIMGLAPSAYGLYFMGVSAGYLLGSLLTNRYSSAVGLDRMIAIGNFFVFIGIIALFVFYRLNISSPLTLFAPTFLITLSSGLVIPNALAGALSARPNNVGTASGLAGFSQVGIGALSTRMVGVLHDGTLYSMLTVMIVAGALSIVCFQFIPGKHSQIEEKT